jgi:hypothetical protein
MTDTAAAPPPTLGHNRPPATFKRTCPECGEKFAAGRIDRLFCSDEHKASFHNRSSKIGRSLTPLAMAWRAGRNAKGQTPLARALRASAARAFSDMCRVLDVAVTEDRAAGRIPKLDYLRARWSAEGTLTAEERVAYHEKALAKAKADLAAQAAKPKAQA